MNIASPADSNSSVVVLNDVAWPTYEALREAERNRHIRMTFDHGTLLLMSPSRLHERIGDLLAQMVHAWTEIKEIPRLSGGSTTMKSRFLGRGLEPDKSFYIQNESVVRNSDEYDADEDPPPDLAIEVDVTSLSAVRLPIYAAFGVPEIWRWIDGEIQVYRLERHNYVRKDESDCLPGFPLDKATEFLDRRREMDETALLREFRNAIV